MYSIKCIKMVFPLLSYVKWQLCVHRKLIKSMQVRVNMFRHFRRFFFWYFCLKMLNGYRKLIAVTITERHNSKGTCRLNNKLSQISCLDRWLGSQIGELELKLNHFIFPILYKKNILPTDRCYASDLTNPRVHLTIYAMKVNIFVYFSSSESSCKFLENSESHTN